MAGGRPRSAAHRAAGDPVKRVAGLTLIEVLVAMLLMLVVISGSVTFITRGRAAHRTGESLARLEESLDAAFTMLVDEIRLAGYLGLAPPGTAVDGSSTFGTPERADLAVAGDCGPSLALDLGAPVNAADAALAAAPGMPLGCRASPNGRLRRTADSLVIRHAAIEPAPAQAGRLQLETNLRAARLAADGSEVLGIDARRHDLEVERVLRESRLDRATRLAVAASQAAGRRDAACVPGRGTRERHCGLADRGRTRRSGRPGSIGRSLGTARETRRGSAC